MHLPVTTTCRRAATSVLIVVALTGCSGGATTTSSSRAPSSAGTSSAASTSAGPGATTPSPSVSLTPSPAPSATAAAPRRRTAAELRAALLQLTDLPTGFSAEPSDATNGSGGLVSSKAACRSLLALLNTDRPAGSTDSADATFSGGSEGPVISESLDAMGTPAAASALITHLTAAVKACPKATLKITGQGSSSVTVASVSAPHVGSQAYAVRQTAVGGALDGLEVTMVVVRSGDVLVSMTFMGATADDLDGATSLAVDKAASALGVGAAA